jgi:hypothetical protein
MLEAGASEARGLVLWEEYPADVAVFGGLRRRLEDVPAVMVVTEEIAFIAPVLEIEGVAGSGDEAEAECRRNGGEETIFE